MEEPEEIKDRIITHLMENDDEDITDPVLGDWLEKNATNRKFFHLYQQIWEDSASYILQEEFNEKTAWEKVDRINQKHIRLRKRMKNVAYTLSGVAASFLVLFTLSFMGIFDREADIRMSMRADYGNRSEVSLPDGSIVQLNSGSDISYSYNPKEKVRLIYFQGEGFFDVAKSSIPFVVKMNNGVEITVLGTSFNLRAYADDRTIQTSLVEGSIEISHDKDMLLMNVGEMVEFDKETNKLASINGILAHSYGWLENKLYMENMPLSEVCKYLERWYNVDITLQPGLGEKIQYIGVIKEESIVDVLEALSHLSDIRYSMKGKSINITSK